jgi:hypothetical protein
MDELRAIAVAIGSATMIPFCVRWVWHDLRGLIQRMR